MNNQNPNQQFTPSPRRIATAKYASARMNLLLVVILTAVNIILCAIPTSTIYFPFSATVPYLLSSEGSYLYAETGSIAMLIIFAVIGVVLTVPYLVCWKFSKNNHAWMIGALVYFAVDSLLLLGLFVLAGFDFSLIIDILFHAWVIYYLILGVKFGAQLKKLPADEPVANADFTVNTDQNDSNDQSNGDNSNNG